MAFAGPTSYVPTIEAFSAHWAEANTAGQGELVLPDDTSESDLIALGEELQTAAADIQGKLNMREVARGTIDIQKAALLDDLRAFNRYVRGGLPQNPYTNALPNVPSNEAGEGKVLGALDDCANLWGMINAATLPNFTPPMVLPGGRTIEAFNTALAALKASYGQYNEAAKTLTVTIEKRNDKQEQAYAMCRDYRALIKARFDPDSALVVSLPRLTPAPGSTPDAVVLTGVWDAATQQALLTWTASDNAKLERYAVRYVVGDDYETSLETTLASIAKDAPRELLTATGLADPGNQVAFKVYVILETGNERGSNPVVVERPLA